jgi:hypothetical protein
MLKVSSITLSLPCNFSDIFGYIRTKTNILRAIRKDCFQNKSKFIPEGQIVKHVNITIRWLNLNEIIYKRQLIQNEN